MWRRIQADGYDWEVRAVANDSDSVGGHGGRGEEILEFRCADGLRPPRRVAAESGALDRMSDDELRATFRHARPIGGDHYGRPGKRMTDVSL